MNIRYKPTSIQAINNPATSKTGFLWFHSIEVDVGIVIEKEDIQPIIDSLKELDTFIITKARKFGKVKVIK